MSGKLRARRSAVPAPNVVPEAQWFDRPTEIVARELLGAVIVSEVGGVRCTAEIVETEAYTGPDDEASHAHSRFGRTARNDPMFGHAGSTYVYLIYGMHWCVNVVTGAVGFPAAVLLRAGRPLEGVEIARQRRPGRPDRELMRGPGNLARALAIDGELNRHPLNRPPVWLEAGRRVPDAEVASGPRIGITRAADLPLRFWVAASPWVSKNA